MDRLHLLICYSVQFLILEFMRQTCHDWFLMLYLSLRKIHSWVLYICKMILQYHLGSRCSAKRWLLFYSSIILNQNICSVNHLIKHLFVFLSSHSPSICCWMLFHCILLSLFCCCRYIISLQLSIVNYLFSIFYTYLTFLSNYCTILILIKKVVIFWQ